VVTSSEDRTARIWDAATGAERLRLVGHTDQVISAAFSPDGASVVTGSYDRTARIWDTCLCNATYSTDCPAGSFRIEVGGTSIISPEIADGQMQTVACPKAGEVQLFCTEREVTEQARTPDCGVSAVSSTGMSSTAMSSTAMMAHIVTLAGFGVWDGYVS
jgi:WD40 repeat protein